MFPLSPGEFKTRFVILEARAYQIRSQNFNPTRSTKNNLLFHNGTVLVGGCMPGYGTSATSGVPAGVRLLNLMTGEPNEGVLRQES